MAKGTPTPSDSAPIPDFNKTQLHIMQLLWDADEALKPSEIEAKFTWPIENATLRSVLAVMLERGDLDREKRGKAFHYFPRQQKTAAVSDMLSGLARLFGSGSRVGLLSQLMQEDSFSEEEIQQLRELVNNPDKTNTHPKGK
ncbi:MAG: BlaI/MecI/CopY family transcriptional regulator [Verrucomicrobiales bacterium]|nr:BlaI/MecI/CopY family transcriptional regulator [Verrucomicrobiales bacterium]